MVSLIGQNFTVGGQGAQGAFPQPAVSSTQDTAIPSLPQISGGQVASPTPDTQVSDDALQQKRAEAFKQGVQLALPKFFYPVSSVKFTIYKENGQYITKFTNIISGETTQVPEPELMQKISDIGGGSSFVSTSA